MAAGLNRVHRSRGAVSGKATVTYEQLLAGSKVFLVITVSVLVANFLVDLLYTTLDPRVRR